MSSKSYKHLISTNDSVVKEIKKIRSKENNYYGKRQGYKKR